MNATAVIAPSQLLHLSIPANEIQSYVGGLFPKLARFPVADALSTGAVHSLLDVPNTGAKSAAVDCTKQAGDILLTDFPTKAGIPIPVFSESGLGHLLEQAGIHSGWLQFNIWEGGLGIIAIADGSSELLQAIHGTLPMDVGTFFHTFAEGGIEVGCAIWTENPFLLAGGLENILAGLISVWQTCAIYVDPIVFLGSAATSALIGFSVALGLAHSTLGNAAITGIRSGIVGALFAVSPAFGFGALAGFVIYKLGGQLATIHNSSMQALLSIDDEAYRQLVNELSNGNIHVREFIDLAAPRLTFLDRLAILPTEYANMDFKVRSLPDDSACLSDYYHTILPDSTTTFPTDATVFKDAQQLL